MGYLERLLKIQRTELAENNKLLKTNFDIKPKKKQLQNIVKEKVSFNSKPKKVIAAKNKSFKLPNYKCK